MRAGQRRLKRVLDQQNIDSLRFRQNQKRPIVDPGDPVRVQGSSELLHLTSATRATEDLADDSFRRTPRRQNVIGATVVAKGA